jgi:hypothetical protein
MRRSAQKTLTEGKSGSLEQDVEHRWESNRLRKPWIQQTGLGKMPPHEIKNDSLQWGQMTSFSLDWNRAEEPSPLPYGKKNEEAGKFVKMIYELTD